MSEAQLIHAEKMKRGEIEYSGKIIENQKQTGKTNSFVASWRPLLMYVLIFI
jgi:hypothetical protein